MIQVKKCDNFFEAEIEHSEEEDQNNETPEIKITTIKTSKQDSDLDQQEQEEQEEREVVDLKIEDSSKSINLDNQQFRDIEEEALCDGWSEPSNMNRLVSDILKTRKIDPSDQAFKQRRQRLSFE